MWLSDLFVFSQALELLTERVFDTVCGPLSVGELLRRLLECVAGGILLPGGPGEWNNLSRIWMIHVFFESIMKNDESDDETENIVDNCRKVDSSYSQSITSVTVVFSYVYVDDLANWF